MELNWIDAVVFIAFMGTVLAVSLYAGRKENSSEDYFLAGRKLNWWLIGFSLIASNISTEHFVGMAGSAYGRVGLAIASYEWMAAITLVIVAIWLLPKFLKAGIYTMPEFLEYRYDSSTRSIMAIYIMAAYIIVLLSTVLYSGSIAMNAIFNIPQAFQDHFNMLPEQADFWANVTGIWLIGIVAGSYTIYGGLKAVVWSDLLQGGALLLGGALVSIIGLCALGEGNLITGWQNMMEHNEAKLHTILPWNDPDVPWIAVFIGGLWIPNIFYWGLNQFITQRVLGAKNLAEGQRGIMFAAFIKLCIPFIIVIPGIIAYQLYSDVIDKGDKAYPYMIRTLLPPELRGVMFAALCGAVMSTFTAGLNSASTIFTIDIYAKFVNKNMTPQKEVFVGRISTAVFVVIACLWAPIISRFEGVYTYIQEIWGFISPGIVAAFIVGILVKRTPAIAAKSALLLGVPLYGICRFGGKLIPSPDLVKFNDWAFLHHMGLVFLVLVALMLVVTYKRPLLKPIEMPVSSLDITPCPYRFVMGGGVILATVILYIIFW